MNQARATKKQQELLKYVDEFIRENGYGPSYREIMNALDYKSVSTVAVHIDGLIAKGYLARRDHSARSLEVLQHAADGPVAAPVTVVDEFMIELNKRITVAELSSEEYAEVRTALQRIGVELSAKDEAHVEA